jgi:hypothetical protein
MVAGIHFFLGIEQKMEDDEDEDGTSLVEVDYHKYSKKTSGRARETARLVSCAFQTQHYVPIHVLSTGS